MQLVWMGDVTQVHRGVLSLIFICCDRAIETLSAQNLDKVARAIVFPPFTLDLFLSAKQLKVRQNNHLYRSTARKNTLYKILCISNVFPSNWS